VNAFVLRRTTKVFIALRQVLAYNPSLDKRWKKHQQNTAHETADGDGDHTGIIRDYVCFQEETDDAPGPYS
jgi:hypothetical protein